MPTITITSVRNEEDTPVVRDMENRREGETVNAYAMRIHREIKIAIYDVTQKEGFGRDHWESHQLKLTTPELDAVGRALGAVRDTYLPRGGDPTNAKRYIKQELEGAGVELVTLLERFLNGEEIPA